MEKISKTEAEFLRLVGNRVKDFRKDASLSQEQLAEKALIHPTYVSSIETGRANASVCVYRRIASALRIPLVSLLDVNQHRVVPDAMAKAFAEVKALPSKEQRVVMATIKGVLSGMKGKEK